MGERPRLARWADDADLNVLHIEQSFRVGGGQLNDVGRVSLAAEAEAKRDLFARAAVTPRGRTVLPGPPGQRAPA